MSDNPYQQPPYVEKRPRYFDGQYLQVSDFLLEQQYHIDRQRRISQFLQVSGILEGLEVTTDTTKTRLIIKRGSAIDEQGRQILLSNEVMFEETLLKLQSANQFEIDLSKFPRNQSYHLWIAWDQVEADLQEAGGTEKTRFYERPKLLLQPSQNQSPAASVFLALLNSASDGFTIGTSDRRQYSGLKLPASNNNGVTLRSLNGAGDRAVLTGSLSVTGNLTVDNAVFLKGSPSTTGLTVNASGNVGIGTTTPKIHLAIGDNDTGLKQEGDGNLAIYSNNQECMRIVAGDGLRYRDSWVTRNGTITSSGTSVTGNNTSFTTQLQVGDWIVASEQTRRIIAIANNNTLTIDSAFSPELTLATSFHSQSLLLRIQNNGDVGIGTASPSAKLEINGNLKATSATIADALSTTGSNGNLTIAGTSTLNGSLTVNNTVSLKGSLSGTGLTVNASGNVGIGTTTPKIHLAIGDDDTGLKQEGDGKLSIYTNNVERMRIVENGNVGIGTTSPSAKLEVNGNIQVSSIKTTNKVRIKSADGYYLQISDKGTIGSTKTYGGDGPWESFYLEIV